MGCLVLADNKLSPAYDCLSSALTQLLQAVGQSLSSVVANKTRLTF